MQTEVPMLEQCVSVAPHQDSNFRAAGGERSGRAYPLGWGGRKRGGKVSKQPYCCV